MAAYPPGPTRMVDLPAYGANSAPTDRMWLASAAVGFALGDAADRYITPNDFLAEITRNITDVSLGFGDGVGATVSAAGKGKLRYNDTTKTFQVSEDTSAYQNLVQGSGANTQVTFWTGAGTVSGSANLTWVSPILTVGLASSVTGQVTLAASGSANTSSLQAGTAPAASLIYRLPNASPTANQVLSASAPSGGIVTTSWVSQIGPNAPNFSVQINGGGGLFDSNGQFTYDTATNTVLIGSLSALGSLKFRDTTAANGVTFKVNAPSGNNVYTLPDALPTLNQFLQATAVSGVNITLGWGTATAVVPGSPTTSVQFNNAGSFAGDAALTWVSPVLTIGQASTTTGQITLAVSGSANTQSFQAGTSPAASNIYRWPNASPTANQILAASAPVAGIVTLSWVTNVSPNAPNFSVQINGGGGNFDSNGQFTYDTATSTVIIGSTSALGSLKFRDTTTSNGVTFKVSAPSGNNVYTLPDALPALNQVLTATVVSGANITLGWSTPAAAGTTINPSDNLMPYRVNSTTFGDSSLTITTTTLALSQATVVRTSGAPTFYNRIVTPADTGLTASTESVGVQIGGSTSAATVTRQWATGALTTQREYLFVAPTYAFVGASTITTAATVTITNAPQAGTNATITNSFALWVPLGSSLFGNGTISSFSSTSFGTTAVALTAAQLHTSNVVTFGSSINDSSNVGYLINIAGGKIVASSAVQIGWSSVSGVGTSGALLTGLDTSFVRAAAAVIRTTNGSTGIGSLLVAASTATVTGNFSVISSNAATAATYDVARLGANSSGTAATGFGGVFSFSLQSSTTADQQAANQQWFWTTATHASRTAALSWSLVNNATVAEYMRLAAPGPASATYLAIHAGTAPNVWTSGAQAAKLYLIDASGTPATGVAANFSTTSNAGPAWQMLRGRGTNASPVAVNSGDVLGELQFAGYHNTSTNNFANGALIRATTMENWSTGVNGTSLYFFVAPAGGLLPATENMSLRSTGTLRLNASSGSFDATTLLQVGNYGTWNLNVTAAIYTAANGVKGLQVIGTNGQTANLFEVYKDAIVPNLFNVTSILGTQVRAGLGVNAADYAYVGGCLKTNTTSVNNVGSTATDLITYSLRANSLGTNGDAVEIDAWGTFDSTVAAKEVILYFGTTPIYATGAFNFANDSWRIRARVVRTGATTQISVASFDGNFVFVTDNAATAAPTQTLSSAVTIKCTGQGTASDQITQLGLNVKWIPAGQ